MNSLGVLCLLAVEEVFQDESLVLFEDYIFSADESWEESEVFGGHFTFIACSLFEERIYEIIDCFSFNHSFDWNWIVFKDGDECLLNESLIDLVRMFQK